MNGKKTTQVLALVAGMISLALAGQAAAHAKLVSGDPAENATVATPKTITLHFNEKLVPRFSGLDLMKADGSMVAVKKATSKDTKAVTITVPTALTAGTYMVMWHAAAADDGHRTKGQYNFTVR
jgi:methionine-rich copper-binding protein CopC